LHCGLRGVVSAAVRLGIVGPHAGQRLQGRQGATLERAIVSSSDSTVEQAASTAPVLDLLGALHDRLYARLFQS
jgi:urease accessory protein